MSSLGDNVWRLDTIVGQEVTNPRFKFFINGSWFGDNKINAKPGDGIIDKDGSSSADDIPLSIGKKSIIFNANTMRYVVVDTASVNDAVVLSTYAKQLYIWNLDYHHDSALQDYT